MYIYRYMFIDPPRDPSLQALSVWPDLAMVAHGRLAAALWKFNPLDRRGAGLPLAWSKSWMIMHFFYWNNHGWVVVWNMNVMTFHSVGNFIIPTDELIFFGGVAQPPTSIQYVISVDISCTLIIMPLKFDNNIYISHYNLTNAYYIYMCVYIYIYMHAHIYIYTYIIWIILWIHWIGLIIIVWA